MLFERIPSNHDQPNSKVDFGMKGKGVINPTSTDTQGRYDDNYNEDTTHLQRCQAKFADQDDDCGQSQPTNIFMMD